MFKWALSVETLTSPDILEMLRAVDGLQKNRSDAKESKPVMAVKRAAVEAVEPHIKPVLWSMISLQLVTGARRRDIAALDVFTRAVESCSAQISTG